MPSLSSTRNVLFLAGVAFVAARPADLIVKRSSYVAVPAPSSASVAPAASSYVAPASSYVAPASSYVAPASSAAPVEPSHSSTAPYSNAPSSGIYVPSASYPASYSSSSYPSPSTTSEPAPPPVATWHIKVLVGDSTFPIGDADPSGFEASWGDVCHENGCDGGTPVTYDYQGVSAGIVGKDQGTFTMTGNVDSNQVITQDLLDAINAALQQSKQCTSVTAEHCMNGKRDPETPGIALDCSWDPIEQCTMANYIQATMYDDQSSQKGQITMSGAGDPDEFDCNSIITAVNGLATSLDLAPPIQGATVFATFLCDAISGDS